MNSTEYMIVVNSTTTTLFPAIYLTFPDTSVPASGFTITIGAWSATLNFI